MNRPNPDFIRPTINEQLKEKFGIKEKKTEQKNIDQDLLDLIKEYNLDKSFIDNIEKREDGKYIIKITNHFSQNKIPRNYFYSGSTARALLARNIGLDISAKPRDIDIIRITSDEKHNEEDKKVSEEFMPDDYKFGHGVHFIEDEEKYFNEVDFTINEVLATDYVIIATKKCLIDTIKHKINLTDFEGERFQRGLPVSKILSKAIRFYTEQKHRFGESEMENIYESDVSAEYYYINPFWLALQLNKAFDKGIIFADEYTKELKSLGQIPDYIENSEQAATYLIHLMKERDNDFSYSIQIEEEQDNKNIVIEDEYEKFPKKVSMKKSKKK